MDKDIEPNSITTTVSGIALSDNIPSAESNRSIITTTYGDTWTTLNTGGTMQNTPYIYDGSIKELPKEPEAIGVPGEIFNDKYGYSWVMSTQGWVMISPNALEIIVFGDKEKGTKKKLRCF